MKEYSVLIMYSEEVKRNVKIYISLPKNYSKEEKAYPVLYLTEGQIPFNDYNDYDGTGWGILEDFQKDETSPEIILIGVGSDSARTNELLPFSFENKRTGKLVGGHSKEYMDFLVHSLKPVIDNKYRTLVSSEHTGLLGFSIGGVCATYAATSYSEHFSLVGAVSSAFIPIREKMLELVKQSDFSMMKKLYVDVGTDESENEVRSKAWLDSNQEIFDVLKGKIDKDRFNCKVIKGGRHEEADWNARVPEIIAFLFGK